MISEALKLDIGCGPQKRAGYVGVDMAPWPGVDHVVDVEKERLPVPDGTASHIFSSHCLEHLRDPMAFWREVARVCQDGAEVEIWTPYAHSNEAYMFSHVNFLNEAHYAHMCIHFPAAYVQMTGAYWAWHEIKYRVSPESVIELDRAGVSLDFGLRYYKNIALEFGVKLRAHKSPQAPVSPRRYVCLSRGGECYPLPDAPAATLEDAAQVLGKSICTPSSPETLHRWFTQSSE